MFVPDETQELFRVIAAVVAASAMLPLALFVYFSATKRVAGSRWRKYSADWRVTDMGRVIMYQKLAWLGFLVFHVFNLFASPYPLEEPFRLVIWTLLVILFWRVFFILRRLQKSSPAELELAEIDLLRQRLRRAERDYDSSGPGEDYAV